MKVLIIGATGHVGRLTVDAALDAGHEVTAFGRSVDRIKRDDARLAVKQGDVTTRKDVHAAMPGHDAVVLTFGAPLTTETMLHRPSLCEDGTRIVVAEMLEHGVPRLVCMSSIGAGDSAGHGRFIFRNLIEPVLLGRIMADRTAQEAVVRESAVEQWVIVRPTELSDDSPAAVRVVDDLEHEPEPGTIARHDVAMTLVSLLGDRSRDGRSIVITN